MAPKTYCWPNFLEYKLILENNMLTTPLYFPSRFTRTLQANYHSNKGHRYPLEKIYLYLIKQPLHAD